MSSNAINGLPIRLVAPITSFQEKHLQRIWAVPIDATGSTGLVNKSTIITEQSRCVALERFVRIQGVVSPIVMEELDIALKTVLDLS